MKLLFFIPSFNDQEGLPELVQSLVNAYPEATVLVIDDGSEPRLVLPPLNHLASIRVFCNVWISTWAWDWSPVWR